MKKSALLLAVAFALLFSGCAQKEGEAAAGDSTGEAMKNTGTLKITSPAYAEGMEYPKKYTCDGQETNPPLEFAGIPNGTRALALVLDDPDAPGGTYNHWIMWNIPPVSGIKRAACLPGQPRDEFRRNQQLCQPVPSIWDAQVYLSCIRPGY